MRNTLSTIVAICVSGTALAQGSVEFLPPEGPVCPGESNVYTAASYMDGKHQEADTYIWDFDNGQVRETRQGTVEYAYPKGGAYMARVTAVFPSGDSATCVQKMVVGMPPSFSGLRTDMENGHKGICLGESVTLQMPISSRKVDYQPHNYYYEDKPQSIYNSSWTGVINFKCFGDRTIEADDDIAMISVTCGHDKETNMSASIEIEAPDGRSAIILPKYHAFIDRIPVESTVKSMYRFDITNNSLWADKLIGSPLNGDWKIRLDSKGTDCDDYVWGVEIWFADKILEEYGFGYTQEYDLRRAVWSGPGVSATSQGTAKATPTMDGNSKYVFSISDNLGCIHDTSTYVTVERALMQGADSSVFIGDEIGFENKTSWAAETSWSFGDKSEIADGASAPHAYYEKNKYEVVMQARSAKGCVDIDTQVVSIVPRPLEVKEVNIFTPNGDGVNDVFTFFREEESFLKSGGLTKMPANIRSIKGKIYNIYGQTVYKWDEVEASIFGWDGTWHNNGSRDCPPGTYFYDIIVYGKDGQTLKRSGSILLVREK